MNRREFLLKSTLLGAAATLPVSRLFAFSQDDPFTTLRRNVGIFTSSGGTIGWLVNNEGIVVIDSQFPDSAKTCISGLEEKATVPFDLLVNTHHHGDHTGGNSVFKDKVEHIVAHDNVPSLQQITAESRGQEVVDAQIYADITYHNTWKKKVGDETVHLKHYGPAHTGGDSVVYFEQANIIHMGDLIFNRAHPFIDYGGGANIANWITTLETVVEEYPADAIYIFGHGNSNFGVTGSKDDVMVMRNFLSALLDYTRKGIEAGKSVDELANVETLDGFEDFKAPDWRLPLSANVKVAYAELTKNK